MVRYIKLIDEVSNLAEAKNSAKDWYDLTTAAAMLPCLTMPSILTNTNPGGKQPVMHDTILGQTDNKYDPRMGNTKGIRHVMS